LNVVGWFQLAVVLGALQGILLAGALLTHPAKRVANRVLAGLMLAFTVYLVMSAYYSAGWIRTYPHFFGLSYPLPWLFGPLVYLYSVTASDSDVRFRSRHALHLLPPILVVLVTLPIYLMSGPEKIAFLDRLQRGDVPATIAVIDPTKYLSGIAYSVATVWYLRQHRRRIEHSYSNTARVNLRWLLWLSGAAAMIWLIAVAVRVVKLVQDSSNGDVVALAIAILVYAIGYLGLRQPEIHRFDEPVKESPPEMEEAPTSAPTVRPIDARPKRSGLGKAEATLLKNELLSLMTREHPYRDPDLTLPDLASRLNTTPHKLSELLNTELEQTFYDFVNGYRVEDVQRRLLESKSKHLNVLALAMDAGFASKSTFNEVFKRRTGQTPSTYRKALAG
jgi:AraC-like DNA-binding protein